jgi:hypothetical protein
VDDPDREPVRIDRFLAILAAALGARTLAVLAIGRDVSIRPGTDAFKYEITARALADGTWLTPDGPLAREPLYPLILLVGDLLPGTGMAGLQTLQIALGAVVPLLLYVGLRPVLSERVRLLAAAWTAVSPHLLYLTPLPLRENLVAPLVTAVVVFGLRAAAGRQRSAVIGGILFALLVHADARFLPLALVAPLCMRMVAGSWGKTRRPLATATLVTLPLLLPYSLVVSRTHDRPVVVTERFLGKWGQRALGREEPARGESPTNRPVDREDWRRRWRDQRRVDRDRMSPEELRYFDTGGEPTTDNIGIWAFRFREYWRFARFAPEYRAYPDGRFAPPWSRRHHLVSALSLLPLILLAPFGLGPFRSAGSIARRSVAATLLFIAAHCALHVAVHARARYRIPMEGLLAIPAAMGAMSLGDRVRHRFAREAPSEDIGP